MKKPGAKMFSIVLWVWAAQAQAGAREAYAEQWTLKLPSTEGGVYQVVLSPEIYGKLQSPGLFDLEVFNAHGQPLPTAVLQPALEVEASSKTVPLAWFALPHPPAQGRRTQESDDMATWVLRNADGTLRLLEAHSAPAVAPSSWLLDTGNRQERLQALSLEWAEGAAPFEQHVDVEGSHNLSQWQPLATQAPLLHLSTEGQALRHNRIELEGTPHRYVRLKLSDANGTLPLTGVRGEFVSRVAAPQNWQWRKLSGRRVEAEGHTHFEFELDGKFPIERVEVVSEQNDTREWTLQSRDRPDSPWRTRKEAWVAYAVQVGGAELRSGTQPLHGLHRERYWRLVPTTPLPHNFAAPTLQLFYRPEAIAFMAQGEAPYALAVGSTQAVRLHAPLHQTLEELRQQKGEGWQPAVATLGPRETLAGEEALRPLPEAPEEPEVLPEKNAWGQWLLWAMLAAGAVLVAAFSLSLLRAHAKGQNPPD